MEKNFRPQWFISFLWNYLPTRSETVISHSRHFRNVFFTSLLNQLLKKLPEPPLRPQLVFFHERKLVITRGRQITACHTHLHMVALPDPLNHLWYLDHLIHQKVSPRAINSSRSLQRGAGVWWSNNGSVNFIRFTTWRTTTRINVNRAQIWFWTIRIQIWSSRENK